MAAVTMSPPQLSSMVMAMPSDNAEIARLTQLRDAAQLADLQVHHVHGAIGVTAQERVQTVDRLIQDERMIGAAADR